jgi:hypothetical protein
VKTILQTALIAIGVGLVAATLGAQTTTPRVAPSIPGTAAGDALRAWLDAYNSGDSAQADAYFRAHQPDKSARDMFYFRGMTGGFDLLTVERNEPGHIEFMVQMRNRPTVGYGALDLTSSAPARIAKLTIDPLGEASSLTSLRIDAAGRSAMIGRVATLMDSLYVFPDVARQIGDTLRARLAVGAYDSYTNAAGFSRRVDKDLAAIAHDGHLKLRFSMPVLPVPRVPAPPTGAEVTAFKEQMAARNCGFRRAEQLDGNIGYLKLDTFRGAEVCGETVAAAMGFVADTRALILDLRSNGGGAPDMVALIASYLFPKRTHLGDLWTRHTGSTREISTLDSVPGRRFGAEKPVYILTSTRTFSAAEEFTYDLQALKRAIVVGESTGGGAHLVGAQRIDDHFMLDVPYARSINPVTRTNWEGHGIEPDVKVPEGEALATALRLLRQRPDR